MNLPGVPILDQLVQVLLGVHLEHCKSNKMLVSTYRQERQVANNGGGAYYQLTVPLAQLLSCSAPDLQRPGKLLAELLFLLPKTRDLLLQVYTNS